jgi:phosphoglycolate phosphatase
MHFDNFIFDLDGTLVDSFKDVYSALVGAVSHLGLPPPTESSIQRNMHLRLDQLVGALYPDGDVNAIMKEFQAQYDGSGYLNTRLYPGVKETLGYLHGRGSRLFVATNKRKIAAEGILSRLKVDEFIEVIMTSDSVFPPLSKDEMVERILLEKELDPAKTAMVGDAKGDAVAAMNNHIFFIFADYGYGTLDHHSINRSETAIIDSFSHLTRYGVENISSDKKRDNR